MNKVLCEQNEFKRFKENTQKVYQIIYDNTCFLYENSGSLYGEGPVVSSYSFFDSKGKMIVPKAGENYFDYLRSIADKDEISISFSQLRENGKEEMLPVFPIELLDMLNESGFGILAAKDHMLHIGMDRCKFQSMIACKEKDQGKILQKKGINS